MALVGGDGPAVVLVAHGSRDPRAAVATRALAGALGAAYPQWPVHASFLDHSLPRPVQVLAGLAGAGYRRVVLVPLLLTAAYHGRVDVPAEVAAARAEGLRLDVKISDVLGPVGDAVDPLLLAGLERRLLEAGPPAAAGAPDVAAGAGAAGAAGPLDAVVLAAAGTRDSAARASVGRAAAALGARLGVPCTVASASAAPPMAGVAVARLRAAGAARVGLAAYFLAPGLLYDATVASARQAGAVAVAAPLGDVPELVRLVGARVAAVVDRRVPAYAA